jgi:hypothetical protein
VNKKTLAALGAAAVLCVAAFAAVIVVKMLKDRGAGSTQEALPANAFVVARVDLERARRWSSWSAVRRLLQGGGGEDAGASLDRVQREWRGMVERCGFDPLDRIDRVVAAADRGVLQGRSQNDWLAHASGRASQAEIRRCIERLVQHAEGRLTPAQVESREVLTLLGPGDSAGPRSPQLHIRERTVMASPMAYMPTALGVAYGSAPRMGNDQPVGRMLAKFNDASLAVVGDVAGFRAQNQQTTAEVVDGLVRANPNIPDLTLARQVMTGGLGARTENGAAIVSIRAQMENANQSRAFSAAVQALIQARRGDVLEAIAGVQGMTQLSRMLPGQNLDAEWRDIDAAFVAARAVVEQGVRTEVDGDTVVLTLTVNAAQVSAFEAGVRAVQRVVGSRGARSPGRFPGGGVPVPGMPMPERTPLEDRAPSPTPSPI